MLAVCVVLRSGATSSQSGAFCPTQHFQRCFQYSSNEDVVFLTCWLPQCIFRGREWPWEPRGVCASDEVEERSQRGELNGARVEGSRSGCFTAAQQSRTESS